MLCWLNGALAPAPMIDAADRGFTLGDGLFETIRVEGGRPRHLALHAARLAEGCRLLRLPSPVEGLAGDMASLIAANGLDRAILRLTYTRGPSPRGLLPPAEVRPTLLMTLSPLPPPPGPARLVVATVTRRNEHSPLSRVKSLNYLDNILARIEAGERGADDALLQNSRGMAADSTIATFFARIGGKVVTPPISDGALPGIGRHLVLAAGLAEEASLPPDALAGAETAFLVSSQGVRAVASLEGRPLPPDQNLIGAMQNAVEG